jgi:hypothetical protein
MRLFGPDRNVDDLLEIAIEVADHQADAAVGPVEPAFERAGDGFAGVAVRAEREPCCPRSALTSRNAKSAKTAKQEILFASFAAFAFFTLAVSLLLLRRRGLAGRDALRFSTSAL